MTTAFRPQLARVLVRQLHEGAALVGLAFFQKEMRIKEGAAYLLSLRAGRMEVVTQALDDGIPDECAAYGLSGLLNAPVWYRTTHPEFVTVRFIAAFPDQNGWSFAGASAAAIPNINADSSGHAWLDVAGGDGRLQPIDAPVDARGMALAQTLTQCAIWPSLEGALYSLPQIEAEWRPDFLRNARLLASVGRGEMEPADYTQTVRGDRRLQQVASWGEVDRDYCKYLARLEALGGLTAMAPSRQDELQAREALASRVVAEMHL
jgi:hypothetical protein